MPGDVLAAVQPNTCLVSIMMANNETGILQVGLFQHRLERMGKDGVTCSRYKRFPVACARSSGTHPRMYPASFFTLTQHRA